jgi:hypothetical protein
VAGAVLQRAFAVAQLNDGAVQGAGVLPAF